MQHWRWKLPGQMLITVNLDCIIIFEFTDPKHFSSFFFPHTFSETALLILQAWNILYGLLSSPLTHFGNFDLGVPDYFMVFM